MRLWAATAPLSLPKPWGGGELLGLAAAVVGGALRRRAGTPGAGRRPRRAGHLPASRTPAPIPCLAPFCSGTAIYDLSPDEGECLHRCSRGEIDIGQRSPQHRGARGRIEVHGLRLVVVECPPRPASRTCSSGKACSPRRCRFGSCRGESTRSRCPDPRPRPSIGRRAPCRSARGGRTACSCGRSAAGTPGMRPRWPWSRCRTVAWKTPSAVG